MPPSDPTRSKYLSQILFISQACFNYIYSKEPNEQKNCIDECEEIHLKQQNININAKLNFNITQLEEINSNCSLECPIPCKNIYSRLNVIGMKNKFTGNTNIIIEYKQFRQFVYKAEPSGNLLNFFCDLGGIFGLYFGIALMDFNKIFEIILIKSKDIINFMLVYDKINFIIKLKRHFVKVKIFIINMGKIRWNILTYAISAPILFTQLFSIIYTYFQYSTETTYEFIPYITSDNKYSVNEFPAITVCTENLFEKIIFGYYYDIDKVNFLNVLYEKMSNKSPLE